MLYESSYDDGLKPFNHDKNRGKWSSSSDFFFACLGHAFKLDAIFVLPSVLFKNTGIFGFIPYLFILIICIIPIILIQSFLGQFSSTGFISSFRVAPLFKGIGYISLVLNFFTLAFYSFFGAIPLYYFFSALQPTIPWSCHAEYEKYKLHPALNSLCEPNYGDTNITIRIEVPSISYFESQMEPVKLGGINLSWELTLCSLAIWGMIAAVALRDVEFIGRFLRYSCTTVLAIMAVCFIRLFFLPYAFTGFESIIMPKGSNFLTYFMIPFVAFSALGSGWGSILTMASYNNFKTNIFKYSWLLGVAHVCVTLGLSFICIFVLNFIQKGNAKHIDVPLIYAQWMEFLIVPSALTFLELPHIWTLLFFGMLVLGCLNLMIVQFLSVMTSLFDEFETLRRSKKSVLLSVVSVLGLGSIVFCTRLGMDLYMLMAHCSVIVQMILNFCMLVAVLWVYGRERFQRDLKFMVGHIYSTFMVYVVRFLTSIFILVTLFINVIFWLNVEWAFGPSLSMTIGTVLIITLVLMIPGYCLLRFLKVNGGFCARLKKCVRPTDWYPADPMDRQRYEESFVDSDITHQLSDTRALSD